MQYILTEEEYNELVPKNNFEELVGKLDKANKKILEITTKGKCMKESGGYCDFCPLNALNTCIIQYKRYSR